MSSAWNVSGRPAKPRRILCGLGISGFLLALPGGILPLRGFHIRSEFGTAGNYFLLLGAGLALGVGLPLRIQERVGGSRLLALGCLVATAALLLLAFGSATPSLWYDSAALFLTGAAAGTINTAVFETIAPGYEADPAGVTLTAGIFFGSGCIVSAWLMSQCVESVNPARILVGTAAVAAASAVAFARAKFPAPAVVPVTISRTIRDLRSPLALVFALLLFFQFGNEWSLAGWLPVFLVDRLGLSPSTALLLLAVFWLAVTGGRVVTARLLPKVRHGRLLAASAFCALFGCVALLGADTRFGTGTGLLLTGAGFSAIYPLAAERISGRFSGYHSGYFNGIVTFSLMGGIIAPFVLGHAAAVWGLRVVPLAAICDSCAVFALVLLIWLGRKVSGG